MRAPPFAASACETRTLCIALGAMMGAVATVSEPTIAAAMIFFSFIRYSPLSIIRYGGGSSGIRVYEMLCHAMLLAEPSLRKRPDTYLPIYLRISNALRLNE